MITSYIIKEKYGDYINHFVVIFLECIGIKLHPSYYASVMLNAFIDLFCSKLCWHNRPGPIYNKMHDYINEAGGVMGAIPHDSMSYYINFLE